MDRDSGIFLSSTSGSSGEDSKEIGMDCSYSEESPKISKKEVLQKTQKKREKQLGTLENTSRACTCMSSSVGMVSTPTKFKSQKMKNNGGNSHLAR